MKAQKQEEQALHKKHQALIIRTRGLSGLSSKSELTQLSPVKFNKKLGGSPLQSSKMNKSHKFKNKIPSCLISCEASY